MGCGQEEQLESNSRVYSEPFPQFDPPPNILFLSIDTQRADHLGCYGYARDTSPNIDHFAAESVRYTQAYAPTPWTLPSHVAMFCGRHPYKLGINDINAAIPLTAPIMTTYLKAAGYQTAAFVDSKPKGMVGAHRGFDRGFDVYKHAPHQASVQSPFVYEMAATVEVAQHWLMQRDVNKPFFLFLHTKSVHGVAEGQGNDPRRFPYDKPEPYRSRYLTVDQAKFIWGGPGEPGAEPYLRYLNKQFAHGTLDPATYSAQRVEALKALYDGGIRYMDQYFGVLMKFLDETGLSQDTIVIVTADHGEGFLEHQFFHHIEVYKQLLHVPLIIRLPRDRMGKVIELPVEIGDIMPTILGFAGLEAPDSIDAIRLPLDSSINRPKRQIFGCYQFGDRGFYDAFSLLEGDWKLLFHKYPKNKTWQADLFNVSSDVDELAPITSKSDRIKAMLKSITMWQGLSSNTQSAISLDPETLNHLRNLGYID